TGLVSRRGVDDLDIFAVPHNRAVAVAVGAVQAVRKVAHRVFLPVIDKIEEGGVVLAVHIDAVVVDIGRDVLAARVHRVLKREGAGVVALTGPVHAVVVAVAVRAVVVVEQAVVILVGVL